MESESFSVERDLCKLQVIVDVFSKFAIRYALIGGIAAGEPPIWISRSRCLRSSCRIY